MKRSTFAQVVALVNGQEVANMDELRAEINTEWQCFEEQKAARRATYDDVKDIVFAAMSKTEPQTVKAIYARCDGIPLDFTSNKLQYALLNYWADEVVKHDNGRSAYTYTLR